MPTTNFGKVKGDDGANVYIKYNSCAADAGASDTFDANTHAYIGVLTSTSKNKPTVGYSWMKFIGDNGMKGQPGKDGLNGLDGTNGINGANGKNCYIKFSTSDSITGATDNWRSGQNWIGFALSDSTTAPTLSEDYKWSKFIDDSMLISVKTMPIDITVASGTKYYLGSTVIGNISGTAIVYLTHCHIQSLSISGTSAIIYINNCSGIENITKSRTSHSSGFGQIFINGESTVRLFYWNQYKVIPLETLTPGESLLAAYELPHNKQPDDLWTINYGINIFDWASDRKSRTVYNRQFNHIYLDANSHKFNTVIVVENTNEGLRYHKTGYISDEPNISKIRFELSEISLSRKAPNTFLL